MQLPLLKNANVNGKTVFLRADLDVPITYQKSKIKDQKEIEDETRLKAAMPTIEYLLKQSAKIIIGGHLGRPKSVEKSLSLEPVAKWFLKSQISKLKTQSHNLNLKTLKIGGFTSWEIIPNLLLLENLRFYKGEGENDPEFARKLASLADIYVNDAFANSHRNHASITGITKFLPHYAGLHLQQEVEVLSGVLENPKRPLVVIIGGAKIETKLPLIEKMHKIADYVLVGGKLAEEVKTLLRIQHEKINPSAGERKSALLIADLNNEGTDITPKSAENFLQILNLAKTVVWNGPMGVIKSKIIRSASSGQKLKIEKTEMGTEMLAKGIVKSSAFVVVGGGDTIGFLEKACLLDSFACMPKNRCFLSTGGGAMLNFLSGEKLPGIETLTK